MPSASTCVKDEIFEEAEDSPVATSEYVILAMAFGLASDAAGIGGDCVYMANALMTLLTAAVVVGVCAAKYGNCVVLLKLGLVDASVVSGAAADSFLEMAGFRSEESGTVPRPVLAPYFVS